MVVALGCVLGIRIFFLGEFLRKCIIFCVMLSTFILYNSVLYTNPGIKALRTPKLRIPGVRRHHPNHFGFLLSCQKPFYRQVNDISTVTISSLTCCFMAFTPAQHQSLAKAETPSSDSISSAVITTATTDKTTFKLLDFPTVDGFVEWFLAYTGGQITALG